MKHDELRAIAHNVAASVGGGCSFLIGVYYVDVLEAAPHSPDGKVRVDFLRGTISGVDPSSPLAQAIALCPVALRDLCEKHGSTVSEFTELTALYWATSEGISFTVTVVDQSGRVSETDYHGPEGHRVRVLDPAGRIRRDSIRRRT